MSINKYLSFKRSVPMLLIGFVFLLASSQSSFGQNIVGQVLSRMDAHNKAMTSLRANVTRVDANDQLKTSDTRQGKVAYRPKGTSPAIKVDWQNPNEVLLVIDKKFKMYRPNLNQMYTGSTDGKGKEGKAGGALAFMGMSREQLKANYDIVFINEETVKGGVKTWHLQMTPKARTSYKQADLWVDGNGMPIQSKITEHNNDSMTVLLFDLQKNVNIAGSEFTINAPKNVKIIPA